MSLQVHGALRKRKWEGDTVLGSGMREEEGVDELLQEIGLKVDSQRR